MSFLGAEEESTHRLLLVGLQNTFLGLNCLIELELNERTSLFQFYFSLALNDLLASAMVIAEW